MKKFPHHCFEIPSPPPTTAMPSLKLSMSAASFSSKPYKWTLSFSPPSSSAALRPCSAPPPPPPPPSPYPSAAAPLVICSSAPIDSSSGRAWRRIPTCAHRALFNDYRYGYTVFRCSSSSRNNNKNKNKTSSLLLGLPSPFPGATTTTSDRRVSISSSPFSPSPSPSSHSHRRNCGSSFSPPKASGFSGSISSPSGGGGVIAEEEDMGSDGKVRDAVEWRRRRGGAVNGLDQPSSSPPSADDTNQNQYCSTKFLTLPTILTLGRVAAVPLLITTFYVDSWWGRTATTSIFIAAAVTDWLDGYLARKMKLGSAFGAFLDPVADKLMVAATLVILCTKPLEVPMIGPVPWLLTVPSIAIIGREITMSAVREWAASQDTKLLEAVAVNNLGKWKTATQMTALTILLAARDGGVGGPGGFVASGVVLLYISAGLSVYSLAVYMSKIWKVLLK